MKKKKLFAVVAMSLAILMTASLSGCGKDSSSEDDAKESTSVVSEISDESSDVESEPETEKPKRKKVQRKSKAPKKRVQRKKAPKVKKFLHPSKKQWTSTKSLWTSMLTL